jgi:protein tyrosine/serine phosphatase
VEGTIERRVRLQGSCNFRDVGGYETADGRTVRWKRLYRSDGLAGLTEEDLVVLGPLGVVTMIDLRSHDELAETGPSPLAAAGARHHHLPFLPEATAPRDYSQLPPLAELYVQMLERGAPTIKAVFDALTDDATYPAVVHCAAGKDRTGVTVALVLRTLGVTDDVIATDYALTDSYLAEFIERMRASGQASRFEQVPPALLRAQAETMIGLLHLLDARFGGTGQFLTDCGVPAAARQELRNLMLESAAN